jgi:integrase
MPRRPTLQPKYRHYKPKDLAVVRLDGRDVYLGKFGSPESYARYHRLVAAWVARKAAAAEQGQPPAVGEAREEPPSPTVSALIAAFFTLHAEGHYRRADGTPTGELDNFRDSLRPLRRLSGTTPAAEFGPKALKAVRQAMIDAGLARTTINQRIGRIVHLFKWGFEHELVAPAVHLALKAVAGLKRGRTAAREPAPVRPVPAAEIAAIRPHVSRQVWTMINIQLLSGMRPGEVIRLRTGDLDMGGAIWVFTPEAHKTEHHDRRRRIFVGPRGQELLRPWLRPDPTAYLFSPAEAMAEFRDAQRRNRTSPLYPSQRARRPKENPKRRLGARYSTRTYYHAIRYGCTRAGIKPWHPHQLRHNAATRLRKEFGLDVARAILGHASAQTAELYAELDAAKAAAAMGAVG